MRGWTLGVSIVIHLCIIIGVIVKPIFATDELPEPPPGVEIVILTHPVPEPPLVLRPREAARPPASFPFEAPNTIVAEPIAPRPLAPAASSTDVGFTTEMGPTGFVPGGPGIVAGNDLPPVPEAAPVKPVRVGGDIRPPQKIRDIAPRYPPIAQASRVEGVVILEATIDEDGSVRDVKVLRGKPLLDDAAVEAVRQWRFTPTRLNGQAVPVVMTVTVSFTLN